MTNELARLRAEPTTDGDLISRKAAIKALVKERSRWAKEHDPSSPNESYRSGVITAEAIIRELPAEPPTDQPAEVLAAIDEKRNDAVFMERIRASVERNKPILERLAAEPLGEQCEDCDREYGADGLVWRATDDLWALVGWGERGLLCPDCFIKRLRALGVQPYFAAVNRETFLRLAEPPTDGDPKENE